jgi:hypothetical protein
VELRSGGPRGLVTEGRGSSPPQHGSAWSYVELGPGGPVGRGP